MFRTLSYPAAALLALLFAPLAAPAEGLSDTAAILADFGVEVSHGDASGYVPDATCAECHADKAESFAEMGMARSFYRPAAEKVIEDFEPGTYFHAPSNRHYRMEWRDGTYWFHRHRLTPDGTEIDRFSVAVDWVLGSGNHSRVYLYQTPDGALHQLPLAWYSQDRKWAMAPGYEFADHGGVLREVSPRCMGCHNAHADYPEGSGREGMAWLYPADLPEGIGCQRCHGPGAEHVRHALAGDTDIETLRAAIVQPGELDRDRLYSICYGCHMQPTVAVNGPLRLGRGHYSFRPGQDLRDFILQLDIVDGHREQGERFDINHHPFRMEQSTCFTASEGALGCLTCHDPHVKVKPEERAAHYRKACLSCHETDADGLPEMVLAEGSHPDIAATEDCTTCHMPERRTQDVIEVWMTDHRIVRRPGTGLLDPIEKLPAQVLEVYLADPDAAVPEEEALALKIGAVLQHTGYRTGYAANALRDLLAENPIAAHEPWMHLLRAYVTQNRFVEAARIAEHTLSLDPANHTSVNLAASAFFKTGQQGRAIRLQQDRLAADPGVASGHVNLAGMLYDSGEIEGARAAAEQALALRPVSWRAMALLSRIAADAGETEAAIGHLTRALDLVPEADDLRRDLIVLLEAAGRADEAARHAAMLD